MLEFKEMSVGDVVDRTRRWQCYLFSYHTEQSGRVEIRKVVLVSQCNSIL